LQIKDPFVLRIMDSLFIAASIIGVIGGVSTIFTNVLIEQYGGVIGGTIGTSPTKVIATTAWIASGFEIFKDHSSFWISRIITSNLLATIFLYLWKQIPFFLPPRIISNQNKLLSALSFSILAWLCVALLLALAINFLRKFGIDDLWIALLEFASHVLLGAFSAKLYPIPAPKGRNCYRPLYFLFRGTFCTILLFVGVLVSPFLDPFAGSLLYSFPVAIITILVGVWRDQGETVSNGSITPLMLGSISDSVYVFLFALFLSCTTSTISAFLAYLSSVTFITIPLLVILKHQQEVLREEKIESISLKEKWKFSYN